MNHVSCRLAELGWQPFFRQQLSPEEERTHIPARVVALNRHLVDLFDDEGAGQISLPSAWLHRSGEELPTVGDWLLLDRHRQPIRILRRKSLFKRMAAGLDARVQLMAANVDTLFVVSSCNQDFNLSRLERYLVLALAAGVEPVLLLTKADLTADASGYLTQAATLHPQLAVLAVNARAAEVAGQLAPWLAVGRTVALVGSSGVGKSTLVNTLSCTDVQAVGAIRPADDKGRHTTTGRSLHLLPGGGLLIDSPGLRELQVSDCAAGLASLFSEIDLLAQECRFRDCRHQDEAGCAVTAAVARGEVAPRRLANYLKLNTEQERTSQILVEKKRKDRSFGKMQKRVLTLKRGDEC
ncbi:MAG: ribosome small subunit-dependent GTPase A [Desulfuromonadales bacterium]|nr:ribosome small subunit-dependent GTPase A [Desulfuromonadales bacterium]